MAHQLRGRADEGISARDGFVAPLHKFVVEDGANIRDLLKPKTQEKIESMAGAYRDGRLPPPVEIWIRPVDKALVIVDGHCRYEAACRANQRGWLKPNFRLPFMAVPLQSEYERTIRMLQTGDIVDVLNDVEIAEGHRRLRGQGATAAEIAKAVGKSEGYVRTKLIIADLPRNVQRLIVDGIVASSTVVTLSRELYGEGHAIESVLGVAQNIAAGLGRQEITPADIRAAFVQVEASRGPARAASEEQTHPVPLLPPVDAITDATEIEAGAETSLKAHHCWRPIIQVRLRPR